MPLSYPEPIRKAIYTSNAIESFSSFVKRELRKKILLNIINEAEVCMTAVAESFNSYAQTRHIRGFGQLTDEERTAMGFRTYVPASKIR